MAIYFWIATIWVCLAVPVWLFIKGASRTEYISDREIELSQEKDKQD